ncbi:MAG: hypothetical protein GYA21_03905 [Myxococcales bacterium]|nr:hypothetical protein [Myxococcales bacterium]
MTRLLLVSSLLLWAGASSADDAPAPPPAALGSASPATRTLDEELFEVFRRANQAYLAGDYAAAITGYERILNAGRIHPDVTYNLANAYYRAGRKGLAVLFYEKTLSKNPADEAARFNLSLVQKELIDRVLPTGGATSAEPPWEAFVRSLPPTGLTYVFLGLYLVFFAVAVTRRFVRSRPLYRLLFWVNVPLLCLALVAGSLLAARMYAEERVHYSVVIVPTAPLREGPERTAKALMELHEGLKVRTLSESGEYVRVRLSNGVEGFLLRNQAGEI